MFIARALCAASATVLILAASPTSADTRGGGPSITIFTYQRQLANAGQPIDGLTCDFEFRLWSDATIGAQVGGTNSLSLPVSDGVFNANLDFGTAFNSGTPRWLEVAVMCPPDSGFTTLAPRTEVKPAPLAQYANEAEIAYSVAWSYIFSVPADIADGDDVNDADADPGNEIQNIWFGITGNTGSTTPNSSIDDLSIVGSGSITTTVSGDTVTISSSGSASPQIVGGGSVFKVFADRDNFLPMGASGSNTFYNESKTRVPLAGTLTNLTGMIREPLTANSYVFTAIKIGSPGSLTCSIADTTSISCTDLVNCVAFAAGDEIAMRVTGTAFNTNDNMMARWNGVFTAGGTCP